MADVEAPQPGLPEDPRRDFRRGAQRRLERRAQGVKVPHRFDHRQRAARQHAVLPADDSVTHLDSHLAERVRAVAEMCSRDCVGDERDTVRGRRPGEQDCLAREVHPVDDQLHDHVGACERGTHDSGVAMAEGTHRIEKVRHGADAAVERRVGFRRGRVAVAARDGDPTSHELVHELERPGKLGRNGDEPHGAGVEQPLEQRRVGVAARGGRVCAEAARREKRPLEMRAEDARAAG